MTETKAKKLIVATIVGAIFLLVFLLSIMIYQLIAIGVSTKKEEELDEQIAEYEQVIEEKKDLRDARSSDWYAKRRANELGYFNGDDMFLGK